MHILNIYKINCIWDICTCTQNISRGAAYICSSLINSMQNAICQLHCRRPQSATCVSRDGSGGKLKSQKASLTPPPQTSVQSQSLTCCFTSDTNTWEKDGAHSDHRELLYWFVEQRFHACLHPPQTLLICVSGGFTCYKVHLFLLLPILSIPRRKHISGFDQSCPI